jgi:cephalosporin hydroxylase
MRREVITVDTQKDVVTVREGERSQSFPIGSPEAFAAVSRAWLRVGWDVKYVYSFTWLGRPIIQLPEDMLRLQEVIYRVKPDVIVETGVAHGGSLVFFASILKAMGRQGPVIGVDVEIRPHNRTAIEQHELAPMIALIEGSSVDPAVVDQVKSHIKPGERVLVVLDSNHSKAHVAAELALYSNLVSPDSYIVVEDGIMQFVAGCVRTGPDWEWNNPCEAIKEFLQAARDFVVEEPPFLFNEGAVQERVTYWPSGYLRRIR